MQWLHQGWDSFWLHPMERVRDGVSLCLAALSAYLAYLAIRLGKQQANLAERQTAIAEKQDRLMPRWTPKTGN